MIKGSQTSVPGRFKRAGQVCMKDQSTCNAWPFNLGVGQGVMSNPHKKKYHQRK